MRIPSLSDDALMAAYMHGDSRAFSELYSRYEKRLFTFLERRLPPGKKDMAPDLFQKTWLQLHQARGDFRSNSELGESFRPWIFTIAANALRDHLGRASTRLDMQLDTIEDENSTSKQPEEILILKQSISEADALIRSLPSAQQEVLILSEWDGLSAAEIGGIFQTSENTVRQTLFRAKKKLKELLDDRSKK